MGGLRGWHRAHPWVPPSLAHAWGHAAAWGQQAGKGLITPCPGMGSFHLVWVWRKSSFGSAQPHPKITRPPMVITELPLQLAASLPAAAGWAGQDRVLGVLGALGKTTHPPCHCSSSCVTPGQEELGQYGISKTGDMAAVPGTALLAWSKGTQTPQAPLPPRCGHAGGTQHTSPLTHGQSVTPFGSSCHDVAWPCPAASPPCSAADPFSF